MDIEFGKDLQEYQKHLQSSRIQAAYNKLMAYLTGLRSYFDKKYNNDFTVGSLYEGRLDTTYFPMTPDAFKDRKLKFVIVFDHAKMQFEIWLAGLNKKIQKECWTTLQNEKWNKYPLTPAPDIGIIQQILTDKPDFTHLDALTCQIDTKAMAFIDDIVKNLA